MARGWRRAHVEKEAMDAGGSERWAVGGSQHARAQVAGRRSYLSIRDLKWPTISVQNP